MAAGGGGVTLSLELAEPLGAAEASRLTLEAEHAAAHPIPGMVEVRRARIAGTRVEIDLGPLPPDVIRLDALQALFSRRGFPLGSALSAYIVERLATITGALHRSVGPSGAPRVHGQLTRHAVLTSESGELVVLGSGLPLLDALIVPVPEDRLDRLRYLAPEQVRGGDVDGRADLYAAAAIYYELLSGSAYQGRLSGDEVLFRALEGHPPELPGRLPDPRPGLLDVLRAALDSEASRRFSVMESFGAAVGAEARHEPSPDPSPRGALGRWVIELAGRFPLATGADTAPRGPAALFAGETSVARGRVIGAVSWGSWIGASSASAAGSTAAPAQLPAQRPVAPDELDEAAPTIPTLMAIDDEGPAESGATGGAEGLSSEWLAVLDDAATVLEGARPITLDGPTPANAGGAGAERHAEVEVVEVRPPAPLAAEDPLPGPEPGAPDPADTARPAEPDLIPRTPVPKDTPARARLELPPPSSPSSPASPVLAGGTLGKAQDPLAALAFGLGAQPPEPRALRFGSGQVMGLRLAAVAIVLVVCGGMYLWMRQSIDGYDPEARGLPGRAKRARDKLRQESAPTLRPAAGAAGAAGTVGATGAPGEAAPSEEATPARPVWPPTFGAPPRRPEEPSAPRDPAIDPSGGGAGSTTPAEPAGSAQAAAPEKRPLGLLSVISNPSGAAVIIDGGFVGETPLIMRHRFDKPAYTIEVALDGYLPWKRDVPVDAEQGTMSVVATLEPEAR